MNQRSSAVSTSIEHLKCGHSSFNAQHGIAMNDHTIFVCVWFRVVERRAPQ
jgi:hypothetical protein